MQIAAETNPSGKTLPNLPTAATKTRACACLNKSSQWINDCLKKKQSYSGHSSIIYGDLGKLGCKFEK